MCWKLNFIKYNISLNKKNDFWYNYIIYHILVHVVDKAKMLPCNKT